ncbi:hypothetical protein TanjilG_23393 [Lupinus angustifolius]|uniref:Uncharacterized protein n=1 Tax=Lupinus angustifolius TaxID=3871 RepID=A0A4P1R9A8_LUPAN|nr:hypothetical protein TanjilG_23393 [Lupinus angustifolius]
MDKLLPESSLAKDERYHGTTMTAASLSGYDALHNIFSETEEEYSTRLANNLEELILKEGPDTIAAFIAEPVIGAGGVIPPPSTYFEKIQAVLNKYDILFVADEIRGTGLILGLEFAKNKSPNDPFPRVGAYFAAHCDKNGLIVRSAGDLIMLCPPLIISSEEVDELISICGEALKATEERVQELKSQLN